MNKVVSAGDVRRVVSGGRSPFVFSVNTRLTVVGGALMLLSETLRRRSN